MKMKSIITAAAALFATTTLASAADMAVKAAPIVPPVIWSWTGFYFGVHVGAGWGETESTLTNVAAVIPGGGALAATGLAIPFSQNSRSGFLGGVQAGYNWQAGWAVFGIQGDFAGADIDGTNPCLVLLSCNSQTNWLATVSGRLGAVVLDRGLVYVKGGGAWMNTDHSVSLPGLGSVAAGLPPGISGANIASTTSTSWGWLIGMGTEWMITPNWSAFVEYNYIRFDNKNEQFGINPALLAAIGAPAGTAVTVGADLRNTLSIAKVGVNYKFNWGIGKNPY